jgi:hypothetical protein
MRKASIRWFALVLASASGLAGCAASRQAESTKRCWDCATALFRDTGSGGSIYNITSASEDAVARVARRYCAEHALGPPTIGDRYAPPMGTGFWGYDFSCAPQEAPMAQQPTGGDLEKAEATCSRIGFQKGTPDYGHCILRLLEMNKAQASQAPGVSLQQLRRSQREQAVKMIRQELDGLTAQPASECTSPAIMTVQLPCGETVSCTKRGDQISCE